MQGLPQSCLTSLLFFGVGAFVASAPRAAGCGNVGTQPSLTPAPLSSMKTPAGPALHLRSAAPTSSLGSAASPSRIGMVDPSMLGGVPSGLRSLLIGASPRTTGCTPSNSIAAFPSMDVYYWPSSSSNTACLSTLTEQLPAPPQPTGMIPPNVYVVYPPFVMYDGCGNAPPPGTETPDDPDYYTTETYLPEEMSTLQDIPGAAPVTQIFNFNDLPCPPPAIAERLDLGSAYRPVVLSLYDPAVVYPPANATDPQEFVGGVEEIVADPARPIVRVNAITGPGQGVPP